MRGHRASREHERLELAAHAHERVRHADNDLAGQMALELAGGLCRRIPRRGHHHDLPPPGPALVFSGNDSDRPRRPFFWPPGTPSPPPLQRTTTPNYPVAERPG